MSRSDVIVLGIYAFFGALAAVIALALGASWWLAILSAIITPPVFTWLAGTLVAHSLISYVEQRGKRK